MLNKRITLFFVVTVFTVHMVTSAQNEASFVYLLTYLEGEYRVTAVDTMTGSQSTVFSILSTVREGIETIFPADELRLLDLYGNSVQSPTEDIRQLVSPVWISSIIPSPDNGSVAVEIKYQRCFRPEPLNEVCFGTTQAVIVNRLSGQQRLLFNIGLNNTEFLSDPTNNPETRIRGIEWFPNQQGLVIEVANRSRSRKTAVIVAPMSGTIPFKVGEGFTSAIAPTSDQIAILSPNSFTGNSLPQVIYTVDFDLSTGTLSTRRRSLGTWLIVDNSQIRYVDSAIVFVVGLENNLFDDGGGLAVLDIATDIASIAIPDLNVTELQSTADGSRAVAQVGDNTLVNVTFNGTTLQFQEIVNFPITDWVLNDSGDLIVQPVGSSNYQYLSISEPSRVISALQFESLLRGAQGSRILEVTW